MPNRDPKLSFQKWSAEWKEARHIEAINRIKAIDHIIDLWKKMPTHQWTRDQMVDVLGFRKNTEKYKGEQEIEDLLLGRGTFKKHEFQCNDKFCDFRALNHNVALSRHRNGQVIADATGIVKVRGKWHPLAIEVKVTQDDCWSAVIQNMQQVRMFRAQGWKSEVEPLATGGVWGMVLAPKEYFDQKESAALEASKKLLERFKECTNSRIALCYSEGLKDKRIECFWSNWSG